MILWLANTTAYRSIYNTLFLLFINVALTSTVHAAMVPSTFYLYNSSLPPSGAIVWQHLAANHNDIFLIVRFSYCVQASAYQQTIINENQP